jgi:hypothetical protein
LTVLLPLACLGLATYTAASRIKTLNSSILDPYLRITINATMPRWAREPDADQRTELEITGFKNSPCKSREDAAKSHGVDPNTLRRQLNGKHKSHKVAHTQQQ